MYTQDKDIMTQSLSGPIFICLPNGKNREVRVEEGARGGLERGGGGLWGSMADVVAAKSIQFLDLIELCRKVFQKAQISLFAVMSTIPIWSSYY